MSSPELPDAKSRKGLQLAAATLNEDARRDLATLRRSHLDALITSGVSVTASHPIRAVEESLVRVRGLRCETDSDLASVRMELHESLRTWVTTASLLRTTFAFALHSDGRSNGIWMRTDAALRAQSQTLEAVFPGVRFEPVEMSSTELVSDFRHLAVLTGIPVAEVDGTRQTTALDTVVRALRGRRYAIVVAAQPLNPRDVQTELDEIRAARGKNYERIKATLTSELGESVATTIGATGGPTMGGGKALGWLAAIASPLSSATSQLGGFGALTYSRTSTKSQSRSAALERLDAFAEAYDAALMEYEERARLGLEIGAWDAACYVLADSAEEVQLAGALWSRQMSSDCVPQERFRIIPITPVDGAAKTLGLPMAGYGAPDRRLFTRLTSDELSCMIGVPAEEHPGFDVRFIPRFAVEAPDHAATEAWQLAIGPVLDRDVELTTAQCRLAQDAMTAHTLVAGVTGSGKSTTVRTLLDQLQCPFLVVEPAKAEYRHLSSSIRVYTAGDEQVTPFRLNPFEVPVGSSLTGHMDMLAAAINATFPMEGPMSALVEQGILKAYEDKGWDIETGEHLLVSDRVALGTLFPTMSDYYQALSEVLEEQGYRGDYGANVRGALLTRIRSLCIGARGRLFNTHELLDVADLVSSPTVIELRRLGNDETKAFFMAMVFVRLYRHFEALADTDPTAALRFLMVVEEAHRLFRKTDDRGGSLVGNNTKHHSVEIFEQIMAEVRAYGMGLVVIDQLPLRLSEGALKNTSTKIIHRLAARDDAEEVGGSMGLNGDDSAFINQLRVGEALVHYAGLPRPRHVRVEAIDRDSVNRSDEDVSRHGVRLGYAARRSPAGTEATIKSIEHGQPGALRAVADHVLFSWFLGPIDDVDIPYRKGLEQVQDLAATTGRQIKSALASAVLRAALRALIEHRWYLRDLPVLRQKAADLVDAATQSATSMVDPVDQDAVVRLRRTLERAGREAKQKPIPLTLADPDACELFTSEAKSHAASLELSSLMVESPLDSNKLSELVDQTRTAVANRLWGRAEDRATQYTSALFILLAGRQTKIRDPAEIKQHVDRIYTGQ